MLASNELTLKPVEPLPEFAGILKNQNSFSSGEPEDAAGKMNGWFDRLLIQSGTETEPGIILLLCMMCFVGFGGLVYVIQENLLSSALVSAMGGLSPIFYLMIAKTRRSTKMQQQLPSMIEELARAAKTGRSLDQCFELVADDTGGALGQELQLCSRRIQMGIGFREALQELPERTGLVSLHILSTALCVHQQMGGDLVRVLERLSQTIRDRLMFLGRLKAATIASRATAILMIALPPVILTFFVLRDPEYFTNLMDSTWGKRTTFMAIALEVVGAVWVLRILKSSQRA